MKHCEVQRCIIIPCLLPFQIRISQSIYFCPDNIRTFISLHQIGISIHLQRLIGSKTLRSRNPISPTQDQLIKNTQIRYKFFFFSIPTYSYRPERRITIVLAELRRSVYTHTIVKSITLFVRIIQCHHKS